MDKIIVLAPPTKRQLLPAFAANKPSILLVCHRLVLLSNKAKGRKLKLEFAANERLLYYYSRTKRKEEAKARILPHAALQ